MAILPTACDGSVSGHPDAHLLPSVMALLDQHVWRRRHLLTEAARARAVLRVGVDDPNVRFSASLRLRSDRLSLRYLRDSQTRIRAIRDSLTGGRA